MVRYLVIVESPAKIKMIKKFLGANYDVDAPDGHVRDLPKSQFGIDAGRDHEPECITIRGKGDILAKPREEVKKVGVIYSATDPDRGGEAISWHLVKALKSDEVKDKRAYRISFNETTKNAIKTSLKALREIDMDLVDVQQTRRILGRMVGYTISPLLWAKAKRDSNVGRVQLVALCMICDRGDEINTFIPEKYWNLEADLLVQGSRKPLATKSYGDKNGKVTAHNKEELNAILKKLKNEKYVAEEAKNGKRVKKAPVSPTTSTLQQEVSKALNFSTQKTVCLAQQLYEGAEVKGHGTVGLITYLHTDSTRIAEEADVATRTYIGEQYGSQYAAQGGAAKKANGKIQDAHEAIRPTGITLTPAMVKESLQRDLFRLYQLIRKRFTTNRMQPAVYDTVSVKVSAGEHSFMLVASKLSFDDSMSVYVQKEDKEDSNMLLGKLEKGVELKLSELKHNQRFIQSPAHFMGASLAKAMEEQGIGRPDTYMPTTTIITARRYVAKENKNLYVTESGEVANRIMKENFPSIVDLQFTANMECLFDRVGDGSAAWKTVVVNFYPDLESAVKRVEKELESVTIADEASEEVCELYGHNMVIKYGPHGRFLACPGFLGCKDTEPYFEKIGMPCPKCGKDIVIKKTKKGRKYYGCESNPECDFMPWQRPSTEKCLECGVCMVEKGNKLLRSDEKCGYSMNLKTK